MAFALGVLVGAVLGIFVMAALAEPDRRWLRQRYWRLGYQARCVEEPIRQLRHLRMLK